MADLNKIAEELGTLTILEAAELVKMLEEQWGVSAAAPTAAAAAPTEAVEEKTTFDVEITSIGEKKISVIKAVREVKSGLGLADAKKLVESAPVIVAEDVSKEEAEKAKAILEAAGAVITIK